MVAVKIIVYCDVITRSRTVSMSLPSSRVTIFFWLAYSLAFCPPRFILCTIFSRVETVNTATRPSGNNVYLKLYTVLV